MAAGAQQHVYRNRHQAARSTLLTHMPSVRTPADWGGIGIPLKCCQVCRCQEGETAGAQQHVQEPAHQPAAGGHVLHRLPLHESLAGRQALLQPRGGMLRFPFAFSLSYFQPVVGDSMPSEQVLQNVTRIKLADGVLAPMISRILG